MKLVKIPDPVLEYKFHPKRKFRTDICWPDKMIMVEVEGGVFSKGRHVRPVGFTNDCEKYNEAACFGYRLLRVTPAQIKNGQALEWIKRIMAL